VQGACVVVLAMDDDEYETPQPDLTLYHDYLEPVHDYQEASVTSQSRDSSSQYEYVLPDGTTQSPDYTPLTAPPPPPAYQPGLTAPCILHLSKHSCLNLVVMTKAQVEQLEP